MSDSDLEGLPADVAALLAVEARRGSRSAARRGAVFARVSRTLTLGGGFGGDGGDGPGDGGSSDTATAEPPANPAPSTGAPVPASAAGAGLGMASVAVLAGATFVLGGIVGAGLSSRSAAPPLLAPQAPAIVVSVSVVAPSAPADPAPVVPSAEASAASNRVAATPAHSASAAGKSSLAEERALLEGARRAIKNGDVAGANRDLDAHAARFPAGQLGEEREALRVQALVRAGSATEARQRAAAFRQRFPDSAFNPAIDASLGAER